MPEGGVQEAPLQQAVDSGPATPGHRGTLIFLVYLLMTTDAYRIRVWRECGSARLRLEPAEAIIGELGKAQTTKKTNITMKKPGPHCGVRGLFVLRCTPDWRHP